jgi:hypothetical protein
VKLGAPESLKLDSPNFVLDCFPFVGVILLLPEEE